MKEERKKEVWDNGDGSDYYMALLDTAVADGRWSLPSRCLGPCHVPGASAEGATCCLLLI